MKREVTGFLGKRGKGILILAVAGLIVFGMALGQAAAAGFPKMDIKLGHSGVLDMSYHKGSLKFAELMKERTGGAVTVQVFPANQLGSEKDMVEQVKNGVIHISLTGPSMLAQFKGWGPIGVLGMPYVLKGKYRGRDTSQTDQTGPGALDAGSQRQGRQGERHPDPGHGLVVW